MVRQSSSWPRAATEYQCTRPEQTDTGGTESGQAESRGRASQPELRTRCPPATGPSGGKPAPGGATPALMEHPGSHSGTADPPPVRAPAHNLGEQQEIWFKM